MTCTINGILFKMSASVSDLKKTCVLIEKNRFVVQRFHLETMIWLFKMKWLKKVKGGSLLLYSEVMYWICECNYAIALIFIENINKDWWSPLHLITVSSGSQDGQLTQSIAPRTQNFFLWLLRSPSTWLI